MHKLFKCPQTDTDADLCSAVMDSNLRRQNRNKAENRIEVEIAISLTQIFDFYYSLKTFFQADVKRLLYYFQISPSHCLL